LFLVWVGGRYQGLYAVGGLLGLPPDPRIAARKLRKRRCLAAALACALAAVLVTAFLAFVMPLVRRWGRGMSINVTPRAA
jgi:hypothetical protein